MLKQFIIRKSTTALALFDKRDNPKHSLFNSKSFKRYILV